MREDQTMGSELESYYFKTEQGVSGPLSLATLLELRENGKINDDTLIKLGDDGPWIHARQGFFSHRNLTEGDSQSDATTRGVGTKIQQFHQKIPFLILFLTIYSYLIWSGIYVPDDHFTKHPRDERLFVGVFGIFTSILWFFFGSIDWSAPRWIKIIAWPIKKMLGPKRGTGENGDSIDQSRP